MNTASDAQARANDIAAFRRELARLDNEGLRPLGDDARQALTAHHDKLLATLAQRFEIDRDADTSQLSLGMRVASFLGALALSASVYFFFYRFWGHFSETAQVAVLLGATLGSFGLTLLIDRRDRSGYFTKLAALVAFVCFVLDISMLGQIFNLAPSDKALLPWAIYAFLLAYLFDLRLLLAAGILCLGAWIAARVGAWRGLYWLSVGERPENFFPAALLIFLLPSWLDHRHYRGFAPIFRVFGLLFLFLPMLVLAHWGAASYLYEGGSDRAIEGGYQVAGFALSALIIWLGARARWPEVVNTGVTFFVVFLYTKLFDWWWASLPKYLFFLLLGLIAVLVLVVLRRLRAHLEAQR